MIMLTYTCKCYFEDTCYKKTTMENQAMVQCDICDTWHSIPISPYEYRHKDFTCYSVSEVCAGVVYKSDPTFLLTAMLRHRFSQRRPKWLLSQVRHEVDAFSAGSRFYDLCFIGCYCGFLYDDFIQSLHRNIDDGIAYYRTSVNWVYRFLVLTHISQCYLWWKRSVHAYRMDEVLVLLDTLYNTHAHDIRLGFSITNSVQLMQSDIFLQYIITSDKYTLVSLGEILQLRDKFSQLQALTEQQRHVHMLLTHVILYKGVVSPIDSPCPDGIISSLRNTLENELQSRALQPQEVLVRTFECRSRVFDLVRMYIEHIGIKEYTILVDLTYLRIKSRVGQYTPNHTDYSSVDNYNPLTYTLWISLDNYTTSQSIIAFDLMPIPSKYRIGTAVMFDSFTPHSSTLRTTYTLPTRYSIDARVLVK